MSLDRFRHLQELFDQALAVPVEDRAEWCRSRADIDSALREQLMRLLQRDQQLKHTPTQRPSEIGVEALEHVSDAKSMPRRRIGRYEIMEEIGRGGMGRVFRALHIELGMTHEVAIKVVRREMLRGPVLRRFMVERQLLAALNHPGIARLLDAGEAADGTPFVAMELVRGEPLLAYCAQNKLDLEARLGLFRQVLAAVSHAHRNLVVHRDIKPGNVMVDREGRVKLLDFGIAKPLSAAADETATAERYFTPAYAAPEQLTGASASVAVDVYSLGALLYELLSGRPPFDFEGRTAGEVERLLLSTPPGTMEQTVETDRRLATSRLGVEDIVPWRRRLRGDLEAIVQCALRKEPERRYASVEQLDADIERFLSRQPVRAAGSNYGYRVRKFIARNQLIVGVSSLAVAGVLIAFTLALRQAQIARQERDRAQAALAVLSDSFKAADPMQLSGGALSARQVLEAASRRVDALGNAQPRLHGELAAELADVRIALGMAEAGDPAMARALAWAESEGRDAALTRRLRLLNARRLVATHAMTEADIELSALEQADPDAADVLSERAHYWLVQTQPERAIPLAERALAALETQRGSLLHAEAAWQLAEAQLRARRTDAARGTLDTLLDLQVRSLGENHPRTLITRLRRIDVLLARKEHEFALAESAALLTELRQHYGEDSSVIALAHAEHASALLAMKRHAEAAEAFEAASAAYAASLGAQHQNTFRMRFNAAQMLAHVGADRSRVDRQFEGAIDGASRARGGDSPLATFFRSEYARAKAERGETEAAQRILLPPGVDPDVAAMSPENRESLRKQLVALFGQMKCDPSRLAPIPTDSTQRAQRLYCDLVPAIPEPG
jgi:eukaryotic-like serine/threonine-protein kinase